MIDKKSHTVKVTQITQDILNWLEENNIEYSYSPHLKRVRYILHPRSREEMKTQFVKDGYDLTFKNKDGLTLFLLIWDDYIKKHESFNIRKRKF